MVQPVPVRNLIRTAKVLITLSSPQMNGRYSATDSVLDSQDSGAPAKLSDQTLMGRGSPVKPHAFGPGSNTRRPSSSMGKLNQLERSCVLGVPPCADAPPEEEEENPFDDTVRQKGGMMWMGSGYMEKKQIDEVRAPMPPWHGHCGAPQP